MMRRRAKVDANHWELAARLRQVGAEVLDLHALPGALDLLVGVRGRLVLVELKDGLKPPSKRKLTPAEQGTIARFRAVGCPVVVAATEDELLQGLGLIGPA